MLKRTISMALAAAMITSMLPVGAMAEDTDTQFAAAVSGYVTMDSTKGTALADSSKTPSIYVDGEDWACVKRAADDLKDDINTITEIMPTVTNDINILPVEGNSGISIGESNTYVSLDFPVNADTDCYIAAYNADGTLDSVKTAKSSGDGDTTTGFKADGAMKKPQGGTLKAFLWKDMQPVTSTLGMVQTDKVDLNGVDVVVGTLGKSKAVDTLAEGEKIDVSAIEGKRESFTLQYVGDTLVIAGSDKRGTIYGIYDLSEKIGISPWSFWADTQSGHADGLYINLPDGGYTEGEPSVQYRGIFLNDEFNMSEWSKSMGVTGKNMNNETYEKIFELLLRLKANYLWPAMHTYSTAFNVTENNAKLADEYGIVMGSSHCEPLLRNNLGELYTYQQEWMAQNPDKSLYLAEKDDAKRDVAWRWTDKDASGKTVYNKEFITDYWRARIQANGGYENTLTLGMRGVHDGKFNGDKTALTEIIAAQRNIIQEELCKDGKEISDIAQVLIPYKEILNIYNQGLDVPDDVTLMWPDDNFGYIRQLPTEKERERSGGAGIYYHLSYFGRPTSYLWLGSTQPGLIREEMTKAYDMGARKIWVANVGDLKPAETEIEYFLDLAYNVDKVREESIAERLADNAKRDFGFDDEKAKEYADIKLGYYETANSRRPEHMVQGLYNLTDFGDEGQSLIDRYTELEERAEVLYNGLDEARKPSLYELLLYPIKGAGAMAKKYVYADKAKQYAENGWGSAANRYAAMSDAAQDDIVSDTSVYTTMLGGKWEKMMNPFQTQLKGSFGGPISGKLSPMTVSRLAYTSMLLLPEGGKDEFVFTAYTTAPKFVDIINTGTGSLDWEITNVPEWIKINKTSGTVADNDRIYISADVSKANGETVSDKLTFTRKIGGTAVQAKDISIKFDARSYDLTSDGGVYVEDNSYVSIEAEHYSTASSNGVYEWKVEKDFGRSGDSVKVYPNNAADVANPSKTASAVLSYDVYFTSSGTFPIDVYRMPAINELNGAAMRFGIGIDSGTPTVFKGNTKTTDNSTGADAWGRGVLQNTEILSGTITVKEPGMHTIELYSGATGVVIDKMVITTGDKKASYYGAPESYNTKYNSAGAVIPNAQEPSQTQTGSITALFEPSIIIADTADTYADIVYLGTPSVQSAVIAAAAYKNGEMINAVFTPFDVPTDVQSGSVQRIEFNALDVSGADEVQYMAVTPGYEPIAPSVTKTSVENAVLAAAYDSGYVYPSSNIKSYTGMESVCVITDEGTDGTDAVRYIRQSTVSDKAYEKIPFNHQGSFDLKINISGADETFSEKVSTIKNIEHDTPEVKTELFKESFESEPSSVTISGAAAYDSVNKAVNMGTGGSMSVDFDKPILSAQGDTVTIVSKIAYGKESKKYMDYAVKDSNGKDIVYSHISPYNTGSQLIKIGDSAVYEATSALPDAIARDNSALKAGYTTYTTVIDYSANTVKLTLESSKGKAEYEGTLPEGTSFDIKQIQFTNTYTVAARTCYVGGISIMKTKAPAYTIDFAPQLNGEAVDADVSVFDGVTNAKIAPEADGTYKLCDGVYWYMAVANTAPVSRMFELSPATESKTIVIDMAE